MALAQKPDILDQLREGIESLTTSEQWTRYLSVMRRFHTYSANNQLLIAIQRPEATHVAGYRRWQQLGRQVRKGSAGIAILAPVANRIKREDDNGEELEPLRVVRAFRTAWIFDVADTDGDPLPEICSRLLGDGPVDAFCKLQAVAGAMDFTVDVTDIPGEVNGFCDYLNHRIVVDGQLSPAQGVKTLAHEIGHAFLHNPERKPAEMGRDLCELEAESVAFVVCAELEIDSSEYSFGYIAGWAGGGDAASKAITASAQRINQAARAILDALEPMAALPTELEVA